MKFLFKKACLLGFLCSIGVGTQKAAAQLGFCTGNSGDPIFTETFGTGTTAGPALPAGTTSYTFTSSDPNDGSYTVSNTTAYFDWHSTTDHTPNDTNGKSLIVNADFTAGEFFKRTVTGLCENTSYEFSSWLMNLLPSSGCSGNGIPINVKFQIWDATDTTVLASGDTGDISNTTSPIWERFGLVFQTVPEQTAVILKMINNGPGGCGNDLAIDDIVFRTCGDYIAITNAQGENHMEACEENRPVSAQLTAEPDFSIYTTHAYQWQQSADGTNWTNIPGETTQNYTTPALSSSTFYRVKVAEDAINLSSQLCSSVSEIFDILIIPPPDDPISDGPMEACANEPKFVSVTVPSNTTVNWYDAATGGNILQENSSTYHPTVSGTYYAEALSVLGDCPSKGRTPVTIRFIALPVVTDEELTFCENTSISLSAGIENVSYLWNTGETTETITVAREGIYTVRVTNNANCSSTKTITLKQINAPIIKSVSSDAYDIFITTENEGDFEFSLDHISYQDIGIFKNIAGGKYTLYVREKSGCGLTYIDFIHFVIPKFFTPNGDGSNDTFVIGGIELYPSYEIAIYDRYGKLLKNITNSNVGWNGIFNNKNLPADDYWYTITIDGTIFKGHFALKR